MRAGRCSPRGLPSEDLHQRATERGEEPAVARIQAQRDQRAGEDREGEGREDEQRRKTFYGGKQLPDPEDDDRGGESGEERRGVPGAVGQKADRDADE